MNENLSSEFYEYLNRHIIGLIKIGTNVKSISLNFEDLEHFGKGILRFYIQIELNENDKLTEQERYDLKNYFYNSEQLSGVKYYSLTYKPNNCGIDLDEIQAFSYGYTFAKEMIENVVSNILNNNCCFNYKKLQDESLFQLVDYYLKETKPEFYNRDFEKNYSKIFNRIFKFDDRWQAELVRKSKEYSEFNFTNYLREEDLKNLPRNLNELLRELIIHSNIPFKISYNNFLLIDRNFLKVKLETIEEESYKVLLKYLDL